MPTLKAILGPTNTGKTHYAIERMLGHGTGMIGLPLRLLAREIYDRITQVKGASACALITGEERIEPPTARYHVCTVEAMPAQRRVDFLAIDEIQLAADRERGHVFTDRILNARGTSETLLLGSETMRDVLRELDLHAGNDVRQRFSQLHHAGPAKLTKLPRRSAIVAFSAEEVYAIAEFLRRHKGGAAVVMGALSPRTRNAQVELYQSGEVDFLIATDAIGMGLNLDVDHIAFAARAKFDGRRHRALSAAECGQIAGRAGRFRSDGTFGETGDCPPFDADMVHAIENHRFEPVTELQWRSGDLDFRSIRTLIASLSRASPHPVLRQNPDALDEWVLRRMAEDGAIGPDVRGERKVRRLWDLARLPDFRKSGHDGHARLVLGLADTLADPDARLGDAGMAKRLEALSTTRGDIAHIQQRLAAIRTWTYAAHRDDWLENPQLWRDKTREIEDSLSDALHGALTARFVDRRTTALLAGLKREDELVSEVGNQGEIIVEGHAVGRLVGLKFEPASSAKTLEGRALRNAAAQALRPILSKRLADIAHARGGTLDFTETGGIRFLGEPVARLARGSEWLRPQTELLGAEEADPTECEAARAAIADWVGRQIATRLPSHDALSRPETCENLEGLARGIAFRLRESGAAIDLRNDDPAHRLSAAQRDALRVIGIRAGRVAAHVPDAQKPAPQQLVSILRTVFDGDACPTAPTGAGSFALQGEWSDAALNANGYLRFGKRAVRADLAERLGWEISKRRRDAGRNAFELPADLASVISCPGDDFPFVLKGFGLTPAEKDPETGAAKLWRYAARSRPDGAAARSDAPRRPGREDQNTGGRRPKPNQGKRPARPEPRGNAARKPERRLPDPDSPFAALAVLLEPKPQEARRKKPRKRRKKPAEAGAFTYRPFQ